VPVPDRVPRNANGRARAERAALDARATLTFRAAAAIVADVTPPDAAELQPQRRAARWRAMVSFVAAATCLTGLYLWSYADCIGGFFHFDDFWVLAAAGRIHLRSASDLLEFFRPIHGFLLYRPLSTVAYFYVLHQLFGYDPAAYHASQIVFHIVNACLVYVVADRLFSSRPLGLASALVYATAPGHAIAACWNALFTITGAALFYFLALWIWLGFDTRWRVPLTLALYMLGLLASEHAVSLPLALSSAAVLLSPRVDWRRMAREQAVFYLIGATYVVSKFYYMHARLADAFPTPEAQAYVRAGYRISFAPHSLLEHLGRYAGFSLDVLYPVTAAGAGALALGILLAAGAVIATACVLLGRWTARPLRVATFGIDVYVVALAPVLVLPAHLYSYYVGVAALGMAVALVGLCQALPRLPGAATAAVVGVLLSVHIGSTARVIRQSDEFRFFHDFSHGAARWLYTMALLNGRPSIEEVVVPANVMTDLVFDQGAAHQLLLCSPFRVRTSAHLDEEQLAPGRVVLAEPALLPGSDGPNRWAWLRHACNR
jgi:hypothetical protein